MLYGIDVSKHQGNVDFAAAARENDMRWAVVKCTEGKDYEDPRFRENWEKLMQLDPASVDADGLQMVRGVYHFARQDLRPDWGRSAGELEARWLCTVLKEVGGYDAGALPPALDWEKYGSTAALNRDWIEGFVHVVQEEIGRPPMIYTGPNVWYYTTGDTDLFVDLPLWEVKYRPSGSDPAANPPEMPRSDGREPWPWTMWQWSGGGDFKYYQQEYGDVAGIPSGVCDVNRFDGTYAELLSLASIGDAPEPPPLPPTNPDPAPKLEGGIMPMFDLKAVGTSGFDQTSANVQGLLMANGYGPDGLVNPATDLPDGKPGPKTQAALEAFKVEHGLPGTTIVDPNTWWLLLRDL